MSAPSHSVPFRPAPGTLCNHKANKTGKVSERDEEEEQQPKHSAELTLVPTVLAFDDICDVVIIDRFLRSLTTQLGEAAKDQAYPETGPGRVDYGPLSFVIVIFRQK